MKKLTLFIAMLFAALATEAAPLWMRYPAISPDGKVLNLKVLDVANETPGLGQKVTNTSFWEQFKGKSGEISVSRTEAGKDEVLAITGATISTKSVVASVNEALKIFDTVAKKEAE